MPPTIQFPAWVDTPKRQSKQDRASKRLQFLLCNAALQTVPGGSIAEFARKAQVERSSLHTFVRNGSFSAKTAVKIEKFVGRDTLPYEFLMSPLEIAPA
jgi:hypothetical protein